MFISHNSIHASKTIVLLKLMQQSKGLQHGVNDQTSRWGCVQQTTRQLPDAGLLHAAFWRKCTYRNVSQQITRKLNQISTWFLHHNVCHCLKMPKSVKSQKVKFLHSQGCCTQQTICSVSAICDCLLEIYKIFALSEFCDPRRCWSVCIITVGLKVNFTFFGPNVIGSYNE